MSKLAPPAGEAMPESTEQLIKVQFYETDVGYENLWATPLGTGQYRIESIPFFVYRVSRGDVVAANPDAEGWLQFTGVLAKSGHRTVRARVGNISEEARSLIAAELESRECPTELLRDRLISVDVPEQVSLEGIGAWLTEQGLEWEYADPTYEEMYPEGDAS